MTPKVPRLMGTAEAAAAYGVTTSNLRAIRGLPEPVQTLACGSIWLASEIEAHARERGSKQKR